MPAVRAASLYAACVLAFSLTLPLAAHAQSFNCRYAKTPDEVAICQSSYLSGLDQRMSTLYFRVRNRLNNGARFRLEAQQSRVLQERRGCGADRECIADVYRRRIEDLEQYDVGD